MSPLPSVTLPPVAAAEEEDEEDEDEEEDEALFPLPPPPLPPPGLTPNLAPPGRPMDVTGAGLPIDHANSTEKHGTVTTCTSVRAAEMAPWRAPCEREVTSPLMSAWVLQAVGR